jgi:hypothetical protein
MVPPAAGGPDGSSAPGSPDTGPLRRNHPAYGAEPPGIGATGPAEVAFAGGKLYLLVGNPGGGPETRAQFGPAAAAYGRLFRVTGGQLPGTGQVIRIPAH